MSFQDMTVEDFFRTYVCEKVMFALTCPWPADHGNNYSQTTERRYEAHMTLEEHDESVFRIDVRPLWTIAYGDVEREDCTVSIRFSKGNEIPRGVLKLDFSISIFKFFMNFDFRERKGKSHRFIRAPAFAQAHYLAFMIVVLVDRYCYGIDVFEKYDAERGFAENLRAEIESNILTWTYPPPPHRLTLRGDTIYENVVDKFEAQIEHRMMTIVRSGTHQVTIKYLNNGGITFSYVHMEDDHAYGALLVGAIAYYYAVLEVFNRARGVDVFCVLEKFRNESSVDCRSFVSNSKVTSGFRCFSYVKQPKIRFGESIEEETEEDMVQYIENALRDGGYIEAGATDEEVALLLGSVRASVEAFEVGGDLLPGHLREVEESELQSTLVGGIDMDDLNQKMQEMSTPGESGPVAEAPKRKKLSVFKMFFAHRESAPETRSETTAFKVREPLPDNVWRTLNGYTRAITWTDGVVMRYVDNEVDKLFGLYHSLQFSDDREAVQRTIDEKEGELRQYIERSTEQHEASLAPVRQRQPKTKTAKTLETVLVGRPIVIKPLKEPDDIPGALFGQPGTRPDRDLVEWRTYYSDAMRFEDYKMLVMMKLKSEFLVRVFDRAVTRFGKPLVKPPGDVRYIMVEDLDILECVFVCNLIQFTPTYYVRGGLFYFTRDELGVFLSFMECWLIEHDMGQLEDTVRAFGDVSPLEQADLDKIQGYFERLSKFKKGLEVYVFRPPEVPEQKPDDEEDFVDVVEEARRLREAKSNGKPINRNTYL